jgi:hypothetical protein
MKVSRQLLSAIRKRNKRASNGNVLLVFVEQAEINLSTIRFYPLAVLCTTALRKGFNGFDQAK